jgi:hypothetical protein
MNNPALPTVPPAILAALASHLQLTGSTLSIEQALTLAITEWQAGRNQHSAVAASELRGYQWKTLFLPESTELRIIYGGHSHYAQVVGDHIIFRGRNVSPREMAMTIAGSVRNAWREIWLRFPGTRNWRCAHACRIEQQKRDQTPRVSPAESMATAAAAMSAALKTALLLVEQTSTQAAQHIERRLAPLRRESDRLHDDIAFE